MNVAGWYEGGGVKHTSTTQYLTLIRHIEEGDGVDEDVVEDVDDGNGRSAVEAVGQALLPFLDNVEDQT